MPLLDVVTAEARASFARNRAMASNVKWSRMAAHSMRQRIIPLIPVTMLLLCVCPQILPGSLSPQSGLIAVEDNIREAIVRYQISNWDLNAQVFLIELADKDPTKAFLSRFSNVGRPVKKRSDAKTPHRASPFAAVLDKKTKKRGVIFDQGSIQWISDAKVDVEGGYYCGSLCSAGGIYHLDRRDGRWVVTSFDISVQS